MPSYPSMEVYTRIFKLTILSLIQDLKSAYPVSIAQNGKPDSCISSASQAKGAYNFLATQCHCPPQWLTVHQVRKCNSCRQPNRASAPYQAYHTLQPRQTGLTSELRRNCRPGATKNQARLFLILDTIPFTTTPRSVDTYLHVKPSHHPPHLQRYYICKKQKNTLFINVYHKCSRCM